MFSPLLPRLAAPLVAALALVAPAEAMNFTRIETVDLAGDGMRPTQMILGSGPIQPGDARIFEAFMANLPPTDHYEGTQWGIVLNSPGGSLQEGVRLGESFRAHVVTTLVLNGQACESACAVAYLGGAAAYAVAEATERLLQPGGRLGFHGIAVPEAAMAEANDTLDLARTTNAVIRDYAIRMGVRDDGLVQSLFNTPPEEMEYIDTAAEILGLGITLAVEPFGPPEGWASNVCAASVGGMLEEMRMLEEGARVLEGATRFDTLEAVRSALLDARAASVGPLYDALATAPAATAIDLLVGRPLYLDQGSAEVWRVPLDRGAGFYYDSCFAIARDSGLVTAVTDDVAGDLRVDSYGMLSGFPADLPLW